MRPFLSLMLFLLSFATAMGQENRQLAFDTKDLEIAREADAILSDSMKWNRQDDRECTDDIASGNYSLYCALYKASIDVTGRYDHRRAALQIVRFTVERHDNGSIKDHRLMDWNNSPKTTFAQLKMVLKESIDTISRQLDITGKR